MNVKDENEKKRLAAEASPQLVFALNHELRRNILRLMLRRGKGAVISPAEVSEKLERPLGNVSYHFRVLAANCAVTLAGTRKVRGSTEHLYRRSDELADNRWVTNALRATKVVD